jgi:hypothetical protein
MVLAASIHNAHTNATVGNCLCDCYYNSVYMLAARGTAALSTYVGYAWVMPYGQQLLTVNSAAPGTQATKLLALDGSRFGVRSPTGAEDFSSGPCVQIGTGAHPASYPMGTGGPFPGGKARTGRDTDHSPPCSAEVKNE